MYFAWLREKQDAGAHCLHVQHEHRDVTSIVHTIFIMIGIQKIYYELLTFRLHFPLPARILSSEDNRVIILSFELVNVGD